MNKMFTTAMAIAAVAGLASATIETPPAGYVESATGSGTLFCNSLTNFAGSAMTLGDFSPVGFGSSDTIKVFDAEGKALFAAQYSTSGGYWHNALVDNPDSGDSSNSFPIARGKAIQINSASGKLFVSGPLVNTNETIAASGSYLLIGNASPVAKKLKDFKVLSGYNYSGDYLCFNNGTETKKYVFYKGHWFEKTDFDDSHVSYQYYKDETPIPAGAGLFLYSKKVPRRVISTTVEVPGTL